MEIPEDKLKQIIIEKKLSDEKTLQDISELAYGTQTSLHSALVEKEVITDEKLGELTAQFYKIPFVFLSKQVISKNLLSILPEKLARKHKAIPFDRDENSVKLAMVNPDKQTIAKIIGKKTGKKVIVYLATEEEMKKAFYVYRKNLQRFLDDPLQKEMGQKEAIISEDAPISKIVDLLIEYAFQDAASDIHIEPEEKSSLVRFRIDGILHDVLTVPKSLHDRLITRIKILARLRTDEHLSPQDGKIRMAIDDETIDLRVSLLPVVDGEKAVLRLLTSSAKHLSLNDLGMSNQDLKKVISAYNKPYGMILSTGPTGAGKTTAIYSILKILNTREKNITTIEDPVEYRIKGVNQIHVNKKANLTFANGLRSILRQDPNIIFVGEIRDNETAGIAVNAALTGHLVLSTLHTNDAATTLPRLIDMKVEPFLVASTVNLIIAQRLVRRICEMCRSETVMTFKEMAKNIPKEIIKKNFHEGENITVFKGTGCKLCRTTGYRGRIGLYEVLEISNKIRQQITQKSDSDVILKTAIEEGMISMLDNGLQKVAKGITSIEEILRAIKVEPI